MQYLEPGPGRSIPVDARVDDLLHWETIVVTDDIDALFAKLEASSVTFVSDQIQALPSSYGHRRGFYVKDPDGHVVGIFAR
ncbi:MAG: hypothetical protein HC859_07820 [Bacteroidia bacterium]|nr:hypothetical protein [Bacteroidia bacterium]